MSDLLQDFERDCEAAGVKPQAAVERGGLHPMNWYRWRSGQVSPTLKNFEAARSGLEDIRQERAASGLGAA